MRDIGSYLSMVNALNAQVVTGTTATDNTEINGFAVDRELVQAGRPVMLSAKLGVQYDYAFPATATLTLTGHVQHSSVSTAGWADLAFKNGSTSVAVTVGSTASTATQTGTGVLTGNVDLSGAKRYIRMQITPNWSTLTTLTEDVDLGAMFVLGGYDTLPASTAS